MCFSNFNTCILADIDDKLSSQLQKLKQNGKLQSWRTKVLGGGRIRHEPDKKSLFVYGYSQVNLIFLL